MLLYASYKYAARKYCLSAGNIIGRGFTHIDPIDANSGQASLLYSFFDDLGS